MENLGVTVEDVGVTKNDFISRDEIDATLREKLNKADVLLLPAINFREGVPFCFPERTGEIFKFLETELAKSNHTIELAVSDDEYKEIELHDWWVYLPSFLIENQVFLPMIVNLLSSWVYDKFSKTPVAKEEPKVKFSATVKTKQGYKKIIFEGDNKSFKQLADKIEL